METQIRQVQKIDTEAFANEQWLINDKKYNFLPQRETFYLGVYSDEKLIAYAQTEIRGGIAETRSLLVKDGLQGQGIGTQLLGYVENWAKQEKKCRKSVIKTSSGWPKTVHFYEKIGYKKDATLANYYYGVNWYFMSKEL
jgi:ribosomal-protein-alanine N-acetyltransferase